jgi:hypothetical protein
VDVDIPKSDSGDLTDKGTQLGDWLTQRPDTFWTIVVVVIIAAILVPLMQRPFVRGLIIGAIILGIIALAWL